MLREHQTDYNTQSKVIKCQNNYVDVRSNANFRHIDTHYQVWRHLGLGFTRF